MSNKAWQVGRSTEEQVKIVARVLDREDEVNISDTSSQLGWEPSARPTMGHRPVAGGSVKSFNSNSSTRGTKTWSRVSKNDGRSSVGSSNTPFAFSKQSSNKASSDTGNTPFANSKQN